ncbi:alpha/beta hydrolase [Rhizobium sp. Leaf383]|uniref:alpha/beta fold hydrolase n=1 Tax=Rhizobium sp. Leaf383 TaxID=1736357 RepID=UPI0012E392CF|nr:alpha/beta hydrolase [Rhizobium sp. Leaf383]
MAFEDRRLASPSGADLAVYHLPATTPTRGVLLVNHGVAEHGRRYIDFARSMAAQGFAVYVHDHRGHGATRSPAELQGRFAPDGGVDAVLTDVAAVRNEAASEHPGLPIILFGHSMGGLVALNAAERDPELYDGLAIWNSNFHPGLLGRLGQRVLAIERMLKGSDVPSPLIARFTFGEWARSVAHRRTDFDWLSRNPAEVDAYIADPLCGFDITVSLWVEMLRMCFAGGELDRLRRLPPQMPVNLVGGGEDPVTKKGKATVWLQARMKKAGLQRVTTMIYPGARHDTLKDTVRERAIQAFSVWCLGVIGRPSVGT